MVRFFLLCASLWACHDNTLGVVRNTEPEAEILTPREETVIVEGRALTLEGAVYDAESAFDRLNVYWESDENGLFVGDMVSEEPTVSMSLPAGLSAGDHTIRLVVSDPEGLSATAEVVVTSVPNTIPVVEFVSPSEGDQLVADSTVTLVASVTDEHTLTEDLQLLWSSDVIVGRCQLRGEHGLAFPGGRAAFWDPCSDLGSH